uniref:type IV secretion system DNA-binding domain-containing protein n=1 Tax=Methylobacterium sp. TaxID=409 RepID=UPI0020C8B6BF|nr:type IV secretion system DNA-binding domain-containing protein [Methylobacterium sp.]
MRGGRTPPGFDPDEGPPSSPGQDRFCRLDIYSGRCFDPKSDDTGSVSEDTRSVGEAKNPPPLDPDEGERPLRVPLGVLSCIACCIGLIWAIGQIDLPCADRTWGCPASRTNSGLPVLAMLFCVGIFAGYAVARPRLEWGIDLFLATGFWLIATLVILASGTPLRILVVLILGAGLVFLVLRRDIEALDDTGFIRGSRLMTAAGYTRLLLRQLGGHPERAAARLAIASGDRSGGVWIAGAPLPPGNQSLHILITASTGAGKSVTLRALLDNIRARGERAIVVDNGYEFHRRFGRPDDIVMGPLANDHGWAISNEIRQPYEWARFARSVIPDGHGESRSWHDYAQRFFANVGEALGPRASNHELVAALTSWTPAQLTPLLAGTTSAVMLQEGGERVLTNVRSIFSGYLQGWKYTPEGRFSFRSFMADGSSPAWLWIPYREAELGVSRSLITCWLDTLVTAGFDRAEHAIPTWIVIDELDSLGELSSLIEATTKLRKRRVAIVGAIQSFSQLTTHYGADKARTLLNCFSNILIMRSVEPETADILSRLLGEAERWEDSYSEGTSTSKDGSSSSSGTSTARRQTRVVLPSEIQSLPDLEGFLKPAGPWPVVRVRAELPDG